jgi:cytochrome c551
LRLTDIIALTLLLTAGLTGCHEFPQGKQVYDAYCLNCHSADGSGLGALIPPLNSPGFQELSIDQVACKIKFGNKKVEDFYASFNPMPIFTNLSETDISNLINYMNSQWGSESHMTSPQEVGDALSNCEFNPDNGSNQDQVK